jgi:hypothetical protein
MSRHEWDERFKPMRLKRLGPSVVPAEVVVPLANLPAVLDDLAAAIKAPLAIEGLSVHGQEIVLLGFIPHDERTLGYTFGYGYALSGHPRGRASRWTRLQHRPLLLQPCGLHPRSRTDRGDEAGQGT